MVIGHPDRNAAHRGRARRATRGVHPVGSSLYSQRPKPGNRGGLFPQSVATHFALLAIGLGFRAVCTGRRVAAAGLLLGLTFLAHLIYGYIGALTVWLMAVIPGEKCARGQRFARVAVIG